MDQERIHIHVKCGVCRHSLMNPNLLVDDLPAIDLEAKIHDKLGHVFLSQVYGSFETEFSGVEDLDGSIAHFSCPHCHCPFPISHLCECKAPMVTLCLEIGGLIKVCTRNGCQNHALEFEDADDLFRLYETFSTP